MSWLIDRLKEVHSQVAIGAALTATGAVASQPSSYASGGAVAWLALVPVWVAAVVHVVLPDAIPDKITITANSGPIQPTEKVDA